MKFIWLCIALPYLFIPCWADGASFEELRYTTEIYPPYTFGKDGKPSGISVELLEMVWAELGVTKQRIDILPWARAYHDILNHDNRVLFGVAKIPSREKLFKWACPIISTRYALFTNKPERDYISSSKELEAYQVGTIRSDIGEQLLLEMLDFNVKIASNVSLEANLEMMERGRIDLFVYDEKAAAKVIKQFGYDPYNYKPIYRFPDTMTCFAFSLSTDDSLLTRFQQALSKVVSTEAYKQLFQTYLYPQNEQEANQ